MNRLPAPSTASPPGLPKPVVCNESLALVAGPPSPAYPGRVPATRVLVPLASSLKTELKVALVKYTAPFESAIAAVGKPRLASRANWAGRAPGPPAKVEMTYCSAAAIGYKTASTVQISFVNG